MAVDKKWKEAGDNTGKAFGNFGKTLGKTAKVIFTDDTNKKDEEGHTELGNAWRETGKAFGEAGKSFGKAMESTFNKVVGEDDKEDK